MISKWYEVTCDSCGCGLNHYALNKPTKQMLKDDGFVVKGDKVFCDINCLRKYNTKCLKESK